MSTNLASQIGKVYRYFSFSKVTKLRRSLLNMFLLTSQSNELHTIKQNIVLWTNWFTKKGYPESVTCSFWSHASQSLITVFIQRTKITNKKFNIVLFQKPILHTVLSYNPTGYLCPQCSKFIHAFFKCSLQVFQFFYFCMMHLFKEWEVH